MKASEMIGQLVELICVHGDQEVVHDDDQIVSQITFEEANPDRRYESFVVERM